MAFLPKTLFPSRRAAIAFVHDVGMAAISFGLSMGLRLGFEFDSYQSAVLLPATLMFTATAAVTFLAMQLYRGIWRYASMNDLVQLAKAVSVLIVIFFLEMFLLSRLEGIPRSLPFINWFVLLALLGGPRFLYRWFKDRRFDWHLQQGDRPQIPVLLVGAGDEAELFIRAGRSGGGNYRAVGIVSETKGRVGRQIHGVEVMGTCDELEHVVERLNQTGNHPQRLVLTKDALKGEGVRDLLQQGERLGLSLARMPKVDELKAGLADETEIRPIAIEDLLGRPQQPLDRSAMAAMIEGKRVMITGAGGSIGSELVRQIASFAPAHLMLAENSEYALYLIDRELAGDHAQVQRTSVLADVRDRARMDRVFGEFKPELVFHAAALKHVPLVEENPLEGALTNTIGTRNVADACVKAGVGLMVMISTDKAVNPTNVMGATKRAAEIYCQALDKERGEADGTRFVTVRFGNVLGSTGSVVPLFQKQLQAGGPLTVTDPDMTRYFMTVREAVELVLQSATMGIQDHATDGKIFVLDMGAPVKIIDLARQMIRLAGLEPDKDIEIQITGARPGEKLFEEIFHGEEPPLATDAPGILLASPRIKSLSDTIASLENISDACKRGDLVDLLQEISKQVPEYTSTSNRDGKDQL